MHRHPRRWFWLSAIAALAALPTLADANLQATGRPEVKFKATGPAGLNIEGTTNSMTVSDDGTNVTVRVALRTLSTGIDLRDEHMKRDLDVAHYRTAELTVPRSALQFPRGGSVETRARGKLKLHGQQRDVSFRYTAERSGHGIHVEGTARIRMTSFGIEQPSYMGMTVRPDVDVTATFDVLDR